MIDGSTPVLVGAGQVVRRPGDEVPDLVGMLRLAADAAAGDAGSGGRALLERAAWVGVPEGAWSHPDPGRALAPGARTVLARVGVVQQELVDRALAALAGGAPAALVVGGEVNHGSEAGAARSVAAARSGTTVPDELVETADFGISALELATGLLDPPTVYALLESAWGAARGWDLREHRARIDAVQRRFAAVAAGNPYAWTREPPAGPVTEPGPGNRMVASPYTKLCCSNLRVNVGAALLLTTVDEARAAGIAADRWVFPWASAVGNHAVPVVQRHDLARAPDVEAVLAALPGAADAAHLDLYSCFPVAVQVAAAVLGREADTVTGGMTFAGGPLNSYGLHGLAAMAGVLRSDPGSLGLVTSVSGFLTKYGGSLWSTAPPPLPWTARDVTADAAARDGARRPDAAPADLGAEPLTVVAATVEHGRGGGRRAVAVAETAAGVRTVVTAEAGELLDVTTAGTAVGRALRADIELAPGSPPA